MPGKPIYGVGLDAGARWTRLVVSLLEDGRLRFLGAGLAESQGWVRGRIADQNAVTESIQRALKDAEARAQAPVGSACVGVGGPHLRGANGRGVLDFGQPREIEQRDVNKVVDRASRVQLQEDRTVLQLYPQDFVVDDHPGHRDPRRMVASRLEINVHLITSSHLEHNAIVGAVNQAHLNVEETVFEAMAGGYACVLPEYRREGIAVVDIGAQSTELVIYYGDSMQLASVVRVCGDHFTRDLAQGLCLGFEEAEQVKIEFGAALDHDVADSVMVELPTPDERAPRSAARKVIASILAARTQELFKHVRAEFARVGMDRAALIGGVFLTGGAARLPDLCDAAERVLDCQTRFGLPLGIRDWPDDLADPAWTTAAGLAMYSAKLKAQAEQEMQATGLLGKIMR
jgi:cell division protein FtsA